MVFRQRLERGNVQVRRLACASGYTEDVRGRGIPTLSVSSQALPAEIARVFHATQDAFALLAGYFRTIPAIAVRPSGLVALGRAECGDDLPAVDLDDLLLVPAHEIGVELSDAEGL